MYSELTGNADVAAALRRMAAGGRMPNSMIFAGPDGTGKKHFAIETARALVCRNPGNGESCGNCTACRRAGVFDLPESDKAEDFDNVFLSHHPDVGLIFSPKRQIRVAAIRALETEANFRPSEAESRVFIIDEADKMNQEAANALLKTLEEPPPTTFLILVSARPDALLQTIRSRCQMIRFAPVSATEIRNLLVKKYGRSEEDAELAARMSGGSVSSAIGFDVENFREERAVCLDILKASVRPDGLHKMLETAERLADSKAKERFENSLRILLSLIRDAVAIRAGADSTQISNFDIIDDLSAIAASLSATVLADRIWAIDDLLKSQDVNINRKVALDGLFVKMAFSV